MHHLAVKSNFVDTAPKDKFGGGNDHHHHHHHHHPICPRPRRVGSAIPELLSPLKCSSHSQSNSDGRSGILNMITEKATDGRESICIGCSPVCYSGSPPSRTNNPLVHDVQFVHQMELLSPLTRAKLSDKFGFNTSASPV